MLNFLKKKYKRKDAKNDASNIATPSSMRRILSKLSLNQTVDEPVYERPSSRASNCSTKSKKMRQRSKSLTGGDDRSLSQAEFLSRSIQNLSSDPYNFNSATTISYSGRMTESKSHVEEHQQTVFIPLQTKTQLEDYEVRKHYKGHVTTKENRGQRLVRKASGIRKSVSKSVTKKMDMYEAVFEVVGFGYNKWTHQDFQSKVRDFVPNPELIEGKRKSFKRRQSTDDHELDWTNKTNYAGVKSLLVKYIKGQNYQNLTRLYLAGCQLNKLPDGLERIPLETISLEANKFRDFPLVLCRMTTLKCLYLSDNMIKQVPHHIRDLVNLRYLWIQGNKLKELSTQICRLRNLKYLHAENNNIEEISLAIGVLTNLKGLWLSRNQLQWLPNEVLKCRDLENLDIDHNFIDELPTGIENMPKLRHLKYANNRLNQRQLAQLERKFPLETAKPRASIMANSINIRSNRRSSTTSLY